MLAWGSAGSYSSSRWRLALLGKNLFTGGGIWPLATQKAFHLSFHAANAWLNRYALVLITPSCLQHNGFPFIHASKCETTGIFLFFAPFWDNIGLWKKTPVIYTIPVRTWCKGKTVCTWCERTDLTETYEEWKNRAWERSSILTVSTHQATGWV